MKNNKGFANFILIGAVVLLVVIGGYFALKKNSNIKNSPDISATMPISTTPLTIKVGKVSIDPKVVQELQAGYDEGGHMPWRVDPDSVVSLPGGYSEPGIVPESVQKVSLNFQTGIGIYTITYQGKQYKVTVIQPLVGIRKIW